MVKYLFICYDHTKITQSSMCPITKAPAKYSMYKIEFTDAALADLKSFKKHEQNEIIDGIEANLTYEPTVETRNRSPLRPNQTAEWKLRLGNFAFTMTLIRLFESFQWRLLASRLEIWCCFEVRREVYENCYCITTI